SASTTITVTDMDRAPTVLSPSATEVAENSLLTVTVTASDPDGDVIGSLTATGLPAGASFTPAGDNASGVLSWTPTAGDVGTHTVTFTATNALSGSAATTITVTTPNQSPTAALSVSPGTGNEPLAVTATAVGSSDPDGTIASYRFDFGDGTIVGPQGSPTAPHTYAAGTWTASVIVTDSRGATGTTS